MKATGWLRVCLLVFLGLIAAGAAWGQTNGSIRGTVTDPSGAVIPGANVSVVLTGTDATRTATPDKDGAFEVAELPVGTYAITVDAQGFKKSVSQGVVVSIGHVASV